MVQLLDALYGGEPRTGRLWLASPSSFRRRWDTVGAELGVATTTSRGVTPASLRDGGATQFYALTEDLVRLQHRARWQRLGTLQISVQEVSPVEFLVDLPGSTRGRLREAAAAHPAMVAGALDLLRSQVPCGAWYSALCSR